MVVSDALLRHVHFPTAFLVGERAAPAPMSTKRVGWSGAETGRNVAMQDDKIELSGDVKQLAMYVGATAVFGAGVGAVMGIEPAEQFFAGYLLEQSLSIDNLFVFILVFR